MKIKFVLIAVFAITSLSFIIDLEYKDVAGGELKILMPKNFLKISTKSFKPSAPGQPIPEDYYGNKDTSEKIAFVKLQKGDLKDWEHMLGIMISSSATKIYFSETKSINGNKIYIAKYDASGNKKSFYIDFFLINTKNNTIWGTITCDKKLKEEWFPTSEKILNSIKIN